MQEGFSVFYQGKLFANNLRLVKREEQPIFVKDGDDDRYMGSNITLHFERKAEDTDLATAAQVG